MKEILVILLTAVLTQNFVFIKFMGICPFLGVSDKADKAVGMSFAVIFVMTLSSAATWCVYHYVLAPYGLEYLKTVAFILIIASLVQLIEMFLKKFIPALYASLGIYLPLITTNCAVLGVALINIQQDYSFLRSVFYGFSSGLGFMAAIVIFAGVRERMQLSSPPRAFRGMPIALIAAGLIAMIFSGFSGFNV